MVELAVTVGQQWAYIVYIFEDMAREQRRINKSILKREGKIDASNAMRLVFIERILAKAKKRRLACWLKLEFWKPSKLSTSDAISHFVRPIKDEIAAEQEASIHALRTAYLEWFRTNFDAKGNPIYLNLK